MKKFIQDILVSTCGLISSLITALILVFVELQFDFAIYSFTFWFIIPVGAFFSGFAAASGYYFGAKLFNHKPGGLLLLNMILISVGTFFVMNYLIYISLTIDGKQVSDYVHFSTYLDLSIRNISMRLVRSRSASTGALGSWGYVVAILQILGFAVGGFAVYGWLTSMPYCDKCLKYFSSKGKQKRYFSDLESIQNQYEVMRECVLNNDLKGAIEKHKIEGNEAPWEIDKICSRIELNFCKSCKRHHFKYVISALKKDDWKDIDDLKLETFTESKLSF